MRSPAVAFALLLALPALAAGVGPAALFIPPPAEFPDVTGQSGIRFVAHKWTPDLGPPASLLDLLPPGAPAVADYNRDGWPDLFFPSTQYTNETLNELRGPRSMLWANDGSTVFVPRFMDASDASGLGVRGFAYAAAWGDADGDGWPDLFVGGYRMARLFLSQGDGAFEDVSEAWGLPQDGLVTGAAWRDYDRDGDLDLALAHFSTYAQGDGLVRPEDGPGRANQLLSNDGSRFTDVTAAAGLDAVARRTTAIAWVDADGDGWPDLHAANYGEAAELWRNNGDGTFSESAAAAGLDTALHSTCAGWGDVDGEGRDDALLGAGQGEAAALLLASGPGTYAERGLAWGLGLTEPEPDWGCAAFDYDQDGDLDAIMVRSALEGAMARQPLLLMNKRYHAEDSEPVFLDQTAEAGDGDMPGSARGNLAMPGAFTGLAVLDYNLDGAPDLVAVPADGSPAKLFGNQGGMVWVMANWFKVYLQGQGANPLGLGARVTVTAGSITSARTLGGAGGDGGDGPAPLDFGLLRDVEGGYKGQQFPVSVRVDWPSGGVDHWNNTFRVRNHVLLAEGGAFRTDTQAPDVRLVLSGTQGQRGWFTSAEVGVSFAIKDRALNSPAISGVRSTSCSIDGAPWGPCAPATVRGDGLHVIRILAEDNAGNKAFYTPTIRIDTTRPEAGVASPPATSASAQGRVLAASPQPLPAVCAPAPPAPAPPPAVPALPPMPALPCAPLDAALVVAPVRLDARGLGAAGGAIQAQAGSDGSQVVAALAQDNTSGVHRVTFRVVNPNGSVEASQTLFQAPWTWAWQPGTLALGEHRLEVEVEDGAGWVSLASRRVLVVPQGLGATLDATLAAVRGAAGFEVGVATPFEAGFWTPWKVWVGMPPWKVQASVPLHLETAG